MALVGNLISQSCEASVVFLCGLASDYVWVVLPFIFKAVWIADVLMDY